jgi:hypothetical protein
MSLRNTLYFIRREFMGVVHRIYAFFREFEVKEREIEKDEKIPGVKSRIIWSTLITAKREDEIEVAYSNLNSLKPVLAWSSLTVDGTSHDIRSFINRDYKGEFDNLLWLTQPRVVSRQGHYAGKMGHYNRISLNFLRGWLCNLEQGEDSGAYLFCHTDGDWKMAIRPQSIESLCTFFHSHPSVISISRPMCRYLTQEPDMWPDKEENKAIWYGKKILSTNVIIAPIERIRSLVLEAMNVFPLHRPDLLERVLGKLVAKKGMLVAYPKPEYFKERFFIDLEETREPYSVKGIS